MGFDPIYLIGIDFNYPQGSCGSRVFQYKKVNKVYFKIKEFCDSNGIKIYNAGINSKLEVFDKVDYKELFNG